jgi:hypothetical protein
LSMIRNSNLKYSRVEVINSQRISREIKKSLIRNKVSKSDVEKVDFIIDRFFHYFTLALMHGIKGVIPKFMKFSMVYSYFTNIPRSLKKTLYFSSKAFGYSFYLIAESAIMNKWGYSFRTDKTLLKSIANHNEGDIIYKLLKK